MTRVVEPSGSTAAFISVSVVDHDPAHPASVLPSAIIGQ